MLDKKIMYQFIFLTFVISYIVSGIMIFSSQYGYSVHSWVNSIQEFIMNIPFAIYILSPAIASYLILKKNNKVSSFKEWLKTVFYYKNNILLYLFVFFGLALYILLHLVVAGTTERVLPFYLFFLSIPGNLIIGGLEEAGWMYILQPSLEKKYGFLLSAIFTGLIWLIWHIPLFFIAGTGHHDGYIDFWMFTIQILSFRFFYGAIYKISGKGAIFLCILFHTLFNAASSVFGILPMTWAGTIVSNTAIIVVSLITVKIYNKMNYN